MHLSSKWLVLTFAVMSVAVHAAVPQVRVRLFSGQNMSQVILSGTRMQAKLFGLGADSSLTASTFMLQQSGGKIRVESEGNPDLLVDSVAVSAVRPLYFLGAKGVKRYLPGKVVLKPRGAAYVLAVNVLDMDDYLVGVVHAELGRLEHPQLWAAQSAVARTWFARNQRKFCEQGECYAVTDDVQSQVYHGWPADTARLKRLQTAVALTHDLVVVTAEGRPVEALFHANSGGQTMPSGWYFSERAYLVSVPDSFSVGCPQTHWTKSLDKEAVIAQMASWLRQSAKDSAFRRFVCTYQQPERAEYLTYEGQRLRLRTVREHYKLRSTWFSVSDGSGQVTLHGRGYGHGIGLSQEGAHAMAKKGYAAEEITGFYFPGTHLAAWDDANWSE